MKRIALLALLLLLSGCSQPKAPQPAPPGPRYSSHSTPEFVAWSEELNVRAEPRWAPEVSKLLADPETGVWGGQDGELFHFAVRSRAQVYQRTTYGRPDPASVWTGDLVWLAPGRLAGRTVTRHLIMRDPAGKITDLGPARSPGGAPYDLLDTWDGALRLRDEAGTWYTLHPETRAVRALAEPLPEHLPRHSGVDASIQETLERQVGGLVRAWGVDLPDRSLYALVWREQHFTYGLADRQFRLLGKSAHPGPVPVGALDGDLLGWRGEELVRMNVDTGEEQSLWRGRFAGIPYVGADGWLYLLPKEKVNLRTGEVHQLGALALGGGLTVTVPLGKDLLASGTGHGGAIFLTDLATGRHTMLGRPLPELGQESGEEIAPIDGLAPGPGGLLYALVGTGAQGLPRAHLVAIDPRAGKVVHSLRLEEWVTHLTAGNDGRVYATGRGRVLVIEAP